MKMSPKSVMLLVGVCIAVLGTLLAIGAILAIMNSLGVYTTWMFYETPFALFIVGLFVIILGAIVIWFSSRMKV